MAKVTFTITGGSTLATEIPGTPDEIGAKLEQATFWIQDQADGSKIMIPIRNCQFIKIEKGI